MLFRLVWIVELSPLRWNGELLAECDCAVEIPWVVESIRALLLLFRIVHLVSVIDDIHFDRLVPLDFYGYRFACYHNSWLLLLILPHHLNLLLLLLLMPRAWLLRPLSV